ncbi:MAG: hypothetical protein KF781_08980 [Chitinophagaceae bacterium]|nr:hypothetical protein [Chitinophagaceae bacterium]MCW5905051.1 hypothetical protein [Chitinophagaceae bacterium]
MKKLFIIISLLTATVAMAQSEKYMNAMSSTLQQFGDANTTEELTAVAQKFERIADAEKTQWLPYYYTAFVKTILCLSGKITDIDAMADEATIALDKAASLEPTNSEIYCVRSLIATAKMIVNPQARYMEYGPKINQYIEKAKAADSTNPRPYYIQASNLANTPKQFGGGCDNAKPLALRALELYNSFKPASELHPNWGKETTEKIIENCQ